MLVIENPELGRKIERRAEALGKTVEEFLQSLVENEMDESDSSQEQLPFHVPKRDWREDAVIINYALTDEELKIAEDTSVTAFSHITDSAEYIHNQRRKRRFQQ